MCVYMPKKVQKRGGYYCVEVVAVQVADPSVTKKALWGINSAIT